MLCNSSASLRASALCLCSAFLRFASALADRRAAHPPHRCPHQINSTAVLLIPLPSAPPCCSLLSMPFRCVSMLSFVAAAPGLSSPCLALPLQLLASPWPFESTPQPITSHLRRCNPHRRVSSALPGFSVANQCPASPPHSLAAPPPCHSLPQPGFSELLLCVTLLCVTLLRFSFANQSVPCQSLPEPFPGRSKRFGAPPSLGASKLFRRLSVQTQAVPLPARSNQLHAFASPFASQLILRRSAPF